MATKKKMLQAAAGSATGGGSLDIDEVFSTYLYDGDATTRNIVNGVDLAGEGGLVWIKTRNAANGHFLFDTERGVQKYLQSDTTGAEGTLTNALSAFNSDGFQTMIGLNNTGDSQASWTFRKAPKFFTCLTYTGTGPGSGANEQQVSHDLGAKPGIVMIKRTDATGDWWVFTDVIDGSNDYGYLNQTAAFGSSANNVATESVFNVGGVLNTSGATYVAYLFANNDGDGTFGPTGDQDIIKCGIYTGNGNYIDGKYVDVGFEPQWILQKAASTTGPWLLLDTMRGWDVNTGNQPRLLANATNTEANANSTFAMTGNSGFTIYDTSNSINGNGQTYIYMAIRRDPLAVPEDATEVFAVALRSATSAYSVGFPTDLWIGKETTRANGSYVSDRLRGGTKYLLTPSTGAEQTDGGGIAVFDLQDSFSQGAASQPLVNWNWKRAPGFCDVVAYTGTGSPNVHAPTLSHSLSVPPEMVWVKKRSSTSNWAVVSKVGTGGVQAYLDLNSGNVGTLATTGPSNTWSDYFTATQVIGNGGGGAYDSAFPVTHLNSSGVTYIMYLFASCPGVSKVGSLIKTSSSLNVDCGFTSGARFVLIKRTDSTGDWWVFDTVRGINSGAVDPYLFLNSTAAQGTNFNLLTPLSSGFTINSAFAAGSYIFYAIA